MPRKKKEVKDEEVKDMQVAGIDVSEEGTLVQKVTEALEESKESVIIATQNEPKGVVNHKPNPIRSSQIETKRAVSSFQERRKALRNK